MNNQITEKNYPVQTIWIFKAFIGFFIAGIISLFLFALGVYNIYLIFIVLYTPIYFFLLIFRKKNFHYSLDTEFLTLKQGIFSKQQRHIPYGVIQNIFVKQDLFDRLFSLSSLTIENAAQGGQQGQQSQQKVFGMVIKGNSKKGYGDLIGFQGNTVSIPGLKKSDAETLKNLVLQKMKDNPLAETHSGL